jgi:hypothetical protein
MYGADELPMTSPLAWFSSITTTMWANRGTPLPALAPADDPLGAGVAAVLADGLAPVVAGDGALVPGGEGCRRADVLFDPPPLVQAAQTASRTNIDTRAPRRITR